MGFRNKSFPFPRIYIVLKERETERDLYIFLRQDFLNQSEHLYNRLAIHTGCNPVFYWALVSPWVLGSQTLPSTLPDSINYTGAISQLVPIFTGTLNRKMQKG